VNWSMVVRSNPARVKGGSFSKSPKWAIFNIGPRDDVACVDGFSALQRRDDDPDPAARKNPDPDIRKNPDRRKVRRLGQVAIGWFCIFLNWRKFVLLTRNPTHRKSSIFFRKLVIISEHRNHYNDLNFWFLWISIPAEGFPHKY
jgi:hypothetical protein